MPNPPKPTELKRRQGTYRKDRDQGAERAEVVVLPMADAVPEPPADLGLAGRGVWAKVWAEGITWISADSDWSIVVEACALADDLELARKRYRVTTDPADGRMVTAFSERLAKSLSLLGFSPTDRTRLGLAEVKRVSKLEALIQQKQGS